jgi:hypothetical protein
LLDFPQLSIGADELKPLHYYIENDYNCCKDSKIIGLKVRALDSLRDEIEISIHIIL